MCIVTQVVNHEIIMSYKYLFMFAFLLVVRGHNDTSLPKVILPGNNTLKHETLNATAASMPIVNLNSSDTKLVSEGGVIEPEIPKLKFTVDNITKVLDDDMIKSNITNKTSVVKKSGVSDSFEYNSSDIPHSPTKNVSKIVTQDKTTEVISHNANNSISVKPTLPVPRKPLVTYLSGDEIRLQEVSKKSANNAAISQKLTPNKQKVTLDMLYSSNHGTGPNIIIPVVITIVVVPMFAVLGFLALRRGKEAWKNRHYSRMDFLLDGMYNE